MLYKPDFDEIVPRMEAFWRGELLDRACISVTSPNGRPRRELPVPRTPFGRRAEIGYVLDAAEAKMESTYYAGEAIPVFRPDLGPDLFAVLMGSPLEFQEATTWARPAIKSWDDAPSFEIDTSSFAWQWHLEIYPRAVERAAGRYFVAPPDCHSGGDCLLAMRGGAALCMDLYDNPEAIHAAMRGLEKAVREFHAAWWPLIEANGQRGHTTSWLTTWSPGRSNAIQLDLLAMISPEMFREFFLHELDVQCDALDQTIFHLDGPDAVKHLPVLYELSERHGRKPQGIQWEPGVGQRPMLKWIPLLKEIQSHGLNVWVSCDPQEVEKLLRELSSRGLFIRTWARGPEDADALVRLAATLAHD